MKLSKRFALLTLIAAFTFSSTVTAPISATNHKPTLAQIEAAKKAALYWVSRRQSLSLVAV